MNINNFSSILVFYYHYTIAAINKGGKDIDILLTELDLVVSFAHHNNDKFLIYETIPTTISSNILEELGNKINNYKFSLEGLPTTKEATARHYLENGIEYLYDSCPQLLQNIQTLVDQVMFIGSGSTSGNYVFSLTSAITQGMIFINGEYELNWVFLLDKYIHEAAHTYLFLINQEEFLVLNDPKELYPSPLRKDMRPMEGVYHALFVLMYLLYAFSMIISQVNTLSMEDKQSVINFIKVYLDGMEKSYITVMKQGKLTSIAQSLLEEGYSKVHQSIHLF